MNIKELKTNMTGQDFESYSPTLFHIVSELSQSASTNNIDFATFVQLMTANAGTKINKKIVRKVFNLFDDQKTGFVSIKNLRKLVKELSL